MGRHGGARIFDDTYHCLVKDMTPKMGVSYLSEIVNFLRGSRIQ